MSCKHIPVAPGSQIYCLICGNRLTSSDFPAPEGDGLQQIESRPCEIDGCTQLAHWSYNGTAVCHEDMRAMASMNSDNAEAFAPALVE